MKLLPFCIGLLLFMSGCCASTGGYSGSGYSGYSGGESFLEKRNREHQQRYENHQRQQILHNQRRAEQIQRQQRLNDNPISFPTRPTFNKRY